MNFVAIDVETANADMASICQLGVARYVEGELVEEWSSLVDPEDYFHFINIDIHGITEEDVVGCPTLPEVVSVLARFLNNSICVSHTHFDRVSISRALFEEGARPRRLTSPPSAIRSVPMPTPCRLPAA